MQDDPEKRISDLERGLAQSRAAEVSVEATLRDSTALRALTQADLHNVVFSKPPIGKRGYNEDEVNAFVERVKIEFSRYGRQGYQRLGVFDIPAAPTLVAFGDAFGGEGFVEAALVGD